LQYWTDKCILHYLRNVVRFKQIIYIEQEFDRNSKLKEIIDNLLNSLPGFHLILRTGSLLLSERSRTALEDYFLDYPADCNVDNPAIERRIST